MTREKGWMPQGEAGRMFRTIVVLGSSLALGCGGRTNTPDDEGDTDASGSGGATSGVGGSAGGTVATGGTGGAGTGGAPSGTGGSPLGTGGLGGSGEDCPPAQWDCPEDDLSWMYGEHEALGCSYVMPEHCTCDVSRPSEAGDCPEGTARTCLAGGFESGGAALPELVPFACKCVPFDPETQYCTAACDEYGDVPRGEAICDETDPYINILCGCELPILR